MMKSVVVVILGLVASGCVANSYSPPLAAENAAVVCKKEKPTGSNRPVEVCRAVAGVLDKEGTKRDMSVLQRQSEILNSPH